MKFEVGDFYGRLSRESKFGYKNYVRFFVADEMFRRKSIVVQYSIFLGRSHSHVAQSRTENAVFPLQQWLGEGATMLGFTYIL